MKITIGNYYRITGLVHHTWLNGKTVKAINPGWKDTVTSVLIIDNNQQTYAHNHNLAPILSIKEL